MPGYRRSIYLLVLILVGTVGCDASCFGHNDGAANDAWVLKQDATQQDAQTDTKSDAQTDAAPDPMVIDIADVENRCAPQREVIPPERHQPSALPDDVSETPRLLWQQSTLCPHSERFSGPDAMSDLDIAYGRFTVDGEKRDVVLAKKHGRDDETGGVVPQAVALLDADTGESLKCLALPQGASDWLSLKVVSALDAVLVPYARVASPNRGGDEPWRVVGLVRFDTDTGEVFDRRVLVEPSSDRQSGGVRSLVTENGQIILNWSGKRLVSVDYETGDVLWTLSVENFDVQGDEAPRIVGPYHGRSGRVEVELTSGSDSPSKQFAIDNCGQIAPLDQSSAPIFYVGDYGVWWDSDGSGLVWVVASDGRFVGNLHDCHALAPLDESRLGCVESRSGDDFLPNPVLKVLDITSGEVTEGDYLDEVVDPRPPWSPARKWLVAGADGVLVSAIYRKVSSNSHVYSWYLHSASTFERLGAIDVAEEVGRNERDDEPRAPLIASDGKMFATGWGKVFAIQTRIAGLATSSSPRVSGRLGSPLGGNENRGRVAPNPQ